MNHEHDVVPPRCDGVAYDGRSGVGVAITPRHRGGYTFVELAFRSAANEDIHDLTTAQATALSRALRAYGRRGRFATWIRTRLLDVDWLGLPVDRGSDDEAGAALGTLFPGTWWR